MLTIENLVVDHGKLRAIWDVSLHVDKGARIGLLGANGAGKSTTLGAVLGLYPPAGGDIRYDGTSTIGASPPQNVEAGIALVPEGRRLFGEMTVRENLEMGAYTKSARARVEENIDRAFAGDLPRPDVVTRPAAAGRAVSGRRPHSGGRSHGCAAPDIG